MSDRPHRHVHADAAPPTMSLLRLSAARRLFGAGAILALVWAAVWWVIG